MILCLSMCYLKHTPIVSVTAILKIAKRNQIQSSDLALRESGKTEKSGKKKRKKKAKQI